MSVCPSVCLSVCCMSRPNSRTEYPRKPKIRMIKPIERPKGQISKVKVTRPINAITDNSSNVSRRDSIHLLLTVLSLTHRATAVVKTLRVTAVLFNALTTIFVRVGADRRHYNFLKINLLTLGYISVENVTRVGFLHHNE